MKQENQLFHGSINKDLSVILANAKSHVDGSNVAYFTTDCVYALACCRSREENFVTMSLKDGVHHYYERFSNQLKIMYYGKEGLIYCPKHDAHLINTGGHTWESNKDVPVVLYEHILNVYDEILKEEAKGNIIIHRYDEIDPAEQKLHANYVRDHIDDTQFSEYRAFLYHHFSPLWD